jgi:hypothetical protein
MAEDTIDELKDAIRQIKERLIAIEKEQRWIREDILSGNPTERMHKRIFSKKPEEIKDKKEKINDEIKIEI